MLELMLEVNFEAEPIGAPYTVVACLLYVRGGTAGLPAVPWAFGRSRTLYGTLGTGLGGSSGLGPGADVFERTCERIAAFETGLDLEVSIDLAGDICSDTVAGGGSHFVGDDETVTTEASGVDADNSGTTS